MPESHLPDPDLVDNLIPVVGQEGSHVGQEGSCQETVTHQVAQVFFQALEDSKGGVSPQHRDRLECFEGTLL